MQVSSSAGSSEVGTGTFLLVGAFSSTAWSSDCKTPANPGRPQTEALTAQFPPKYTH